MFMSSMPTIPPKPSLPSHNKALIENIHVYDDAYATKTQAADEKNNLLYAIQPLINPKLLHREDISKPSVVFKRQKKPGLRKTFMLKKVSQNEPHGTDDNPAAYVVWNDTIESTQLTGDSNHESNSSLGVSTPAFVVPLRSANVDYAETFNKEKTKTSDKGKYGNWSEEKNIDMSYETALLNRPKRDVCRMMDLLDSMTDKGEWIQLPNITSEPKWVGSNAREHYSKTYRPCYKRFGMRYHEFCSVSDKTPLSIYLPPTCAFPAVNFNSFKGRQFLLVGDSIIRSAAIGLAIALTEEWGFPYDVSYSDETTESEPLAHGSAKQTNGFCTGWAEQAAMVCWVNFKTPAFGHSLKDILSRQLIAATVHDVILLNFGIHYRIDLAALDAELSELKEVLNEHNILTQTIRPKLLWSETTPQYFNRGLYFKLKEGKQDLDATCQRMDIDEWTTTSRQANRYNNRLNPDLRGLESKGLLNILPNWDAFARLGPQDSLGLRINDGKLDCTHSCLLRERHLYRIQQLQMVLNDMPEINADTLAENRVIFKKKWRNVAKVIFGDNQKSKSYRRNVEDKKTGNGECYIQG
eukprot:CFRG6393T1